MWTGLPLGDVATTIVVMAATNPEHRVHREPVGRRVRATARRAPLVEGATARPYAEGS